MAHTPELDRRTLFKAGLGAAAVAVVGSQLGTAGAAEATPSAEFPWIIDCDTWGARPPSSAIQLSGNVTNKIIVHHMAFPNVTDYSQAHAEQLARDCQDLHMDTNGWADTGQHFTVSRGGYVTEGRHRSLETLEGGKQQVIAAHCPGENGNAIGIENEGTYITETPTSKQWNSLVELCVTICRQYGIHAYDIFGHWDWNDTDCPGIAFYREFPRLRRQVAAELHQHWRDVPARTWPDIFTSSAGSTVTTLQYLLVEAGYGSTVTPNAAFTAGTRAAVRDWQARHGWEVASDGTVTDPVWESLGVRLDRHSTRSNAIMAAQSILAHKGYQVTVNGVYDKDTETAVRQMQLLHGLLPTGVVDTNTWCATVGGIVRNEFLGIF